LVAYLAPPSEAAAASVVTPAVPLAAVADGEMKKPAADEFGSVLDESSRAAVITSSDAAIVTRSADAPVAVAATAAATPPSACLIVLTSSRLLCLAGQDYQGVPARLLDSKGERRVSMEGMDGLGAGADAPGTSVHQQLKPMSAAELSGLSGLKQAREQVQAAASAEADLDQREALHLAWQLHIPQIRSVHASGRDVVITFAQTADLIASAVLVKPDTSLPRGMADLDTVPAGASAAGEPRTSQRGPEQLMTQTLAVESSMEAERVAITLRQFLSAHLFIVQASYGPAGETGRDVTATLTRLVRHHEDRMARKRERGDDMSRFDDQGVCIKLHGAASSTKLFGDPAPGRAKLLTVVYSSNLGLKKAVFQEGAPITLN